MRLVWRSLPSQLARENKRFVYGAARKGARSLRVACEKFAIPKGVRTSLSGYRDDGWLVNIPLWAFSQLRVTDLE